MRAESYQIGFNLYAGERVPPPEARADLEHLAQSILRNSSVEKMILESLGDTVHLAIPKPAKTLPHRPKGPENRR